MHKFELKELTASQRTKLRNLILQYITEPLIQTHKDFHMQHMGGPVHGQHFLDWHRNFVKDLETFLSTQSLTAEEKHRFIPLPIYNPVDPIPAEFSYSPPANHPEWKRVTNSPNWQLPSYFTLAGGNTPDPIFGHTALKQFINAEELGDCIEMSGYHGGLHNTVGGVMATFDSPRDPIFWPWHSHVDDIYWNWQGQLVTVPNVVGLPITITRGNPFIQTAFYRLFINGFKVGKITTTYKFVNTLPTLKRICIDQTPDGGTMAPKGASVDLVELRYIKIPPFLTEPIAVNPDLILPSSDVQPDAH